MNEVLIASCFRGKLDWLDQRKPAMKHSMAVMDILTSKTQGFGGILSKIRARKHPQPSDSSDSTSEEKAPPTSPKDIISLIDHFKRLPKIYPVKPKKKKPKKSQAMIEKYTERKKEREMAMTYGTRRRIRRVDYHCDSLKDIFLSKKENTQTRKSRILNSVA